ncbi:PREDICTED: uncharacterized protein LOC109326362 [Lupinus angustifolius]|uniref:uncharacterized protein LOC109326362 n=1 Tax=Lupinus angustifolius TaxID=3871 RepID=UPI00092F2C04|nr:PREDICTED: uncharacterized protein LOC109326362 [Lupinus angustifolius]
MYQGLRHYSSIIIPHTERTVEIKPAYLNLVSAHQFYGKDYEEPYAHLDNFYELVATMGYTDIEREAAYMMLFPFSLLGEAREWLKSHPTQSLTSWSNLESKFLTRFFHQLGMCMRNLRYQLSGKPKTKKILDAAGGGTMMVVDVEQATRILIALSSTNRQAQHNRRSVQKRGVLDLNTSYAILAQNKILTKQIEALTKQMSKLPQQLNVVQLSPSQQQMLRCDFCEGDHLTGHCSMPSANQTEEVQVGWAIRIGIMVGDQKQGHLIDNHHFSNHSNRINIHQCMKANTQTDPKEHCKAITTRSGKVIGKDVGENLVVEEEVLKKKRLREKKSESVETQDDENITSEEVNKQKEGEKKSDLSQLKNLPYPKNSSKKDKERQYTRFMDIFKNL